MRQKTSLTEKQKKIAAGAALFVFAAVLAAAGAWIGPKIVTLADEPQAFREWIDRHYFLGRLLYTVLMAVQVPMAFVPGEPLEIFGGYAFGAVEGTVLCLAGAAAGSMLVFFTVRRWGVKLAEVFFSAEKLRSLHFLRRGRGREMLFFLIYMIPGTPKDLLGYFAGLTDMRAGMWILICTVGRLPSVITSTVGGDALGMGNYSFAIAVFAVTLILSAAGMAVYRAIQRKREGG